MRVTKRYGWLPDIPDKRDHLYSVERIAALPDSVDLRPGCPPVYDQLSLGSCTAQAIAAALEFDRDNSPRLKSGASHPTLHLLVYVNG